MSKNKKKRNFQILFIFLSWSIPFVINAESYSQYRLDDFVSAKDFGKVQNKSLTRSQSQDGSLSIYGYGLGTSQKGGEDSWQSRRYLGQALVSPEVGFKGNNEKISWGATASAILGAQEKTIASREVRTLADWEVVLDIAYTNGSLRFVGEGGRGFQRLDSFGFLWNTISNYGQFRSQWGDRVTATLLGLEAEFQNFSVFQSPNPREGSGKPKLWGGELLAKDIWLTKQARLFGYRIIEPEQRVFWENQILFQPYRNYSNVGLEWISETFASHFQLDMFLCIQKGYQDKKTVPWDQERFSKYAPFAYGSLQYKKESYSFAISALATELNPTNNGDRREDGFTSLFAKPRVLGGFSSFWLYEGLPLGAGNLFSDLGNEGRGSFQNNGKQLGGFQFSIPLTKDWETDVFINGMVSTIGRGSEAIFRARYNLSEEKKSFLMGSLCYATLEREQEFWRWYLSGSYVF